MKTKQIKLLGTLLLLLCLALSTAQETKNQAYYVHEDQVKPSMISEYHAISKEFSEACKKHNLQDYSYNVAATNTGKYMSITPIEKFADLDVNVMAPLAEKMGEEAFTDLFNRFNSCYDKHGDYIVFLNNELTYMPQGIDVNTPGEDYRIWHRMNVAPENIQKLKGKLKELKALYTKKGAKEYYRIYHNGFGNMGDYYLAVISAKDAQDLARKTAESDALLGEEGEKLFQEIFKYVSSYTVETGRILPDLAYTPSK